MKFFDFFAGIGGFRLGMEMAGHECVGHCEIDKYAHASYVAMHRPKESEVYFGDIRTVDPWDIPECDIYCGGFPCQAFSIAGYRKGFEDEKGRGTLFFELLRLIKAKAPRVVLLENVKNLKGHDKGNTFRVIKEALEDAGYKVDYKVLNAMEYGNTPQNRERIYIVGFKESSDFEKFKFPAPVPLTSSIRDIIDFVHPADEKYYYRKGKYKGNLYETLDEQMDDPNTVYQWRRVYVRKNQSNVVPTLTANMGEGGHNVPLVRVYTGIRKLTPKECFRLQGFPDEYFERAAEVNSDSQLYKQAGNSVTVNVIYEIARRFK